MKKMLKGVGVGVTLAAVAAFFAARIAMAISLYKVGVKLWIIIAAFVCVSVGDMFYIGVGIVEKLWIPIIIYAAAAVILGIGSAIAGDNK